MSPIAVVITVSDRSAAGLRKDASGPVAVAALRNAGFDCADAMIVSDGADAVENALRTALDLGATLVVTTGGTGVAPRDQTPEGTARVIEREIPGIAEELRRRGQLETPAAVLTRGLAGVAGDALLVNLPGSPRAVASGIPVVTAVAAHVRAQLSGGDHA
ncbi:molybdenum cofactor biosynthesis protein B [uncultured Microbacterium sp.]|uniref:MogA/MoaB family molybdenum cofactor biosynthesis protein n=1 Tax=uncultured Microbacterium sp. TaxID=191216 RepID=UPI0025E1301B|nr:MogA/MoaB family molybdenum cofactor biosynthesis protein [uncultured Microbacterium sp.]